MVASAIDLQYVVGKISECTRTGSRKQSRRCLCPVLSLFKSVEPVCTTGHLATRWWPLADALQHTPAPSGVDIPPTPPRTSCWAPLQISAVALCALLLSCRNTLNPKLDCNYCLPPGNREFCTNREGNCADVTILWHRAGRD